MPARNAIKEYKEQGFYHLYNRGVEKRLIFLDQQDHGVFLSYFKDYLLPKNEEELRDALTNPAISSKEKDKILKLLRLNNFADELTLLTYCLMPNHFHLLVRQQTARTIHAFMQSLCTRYTMYFNRKYKRVGPLFQSVYKGVLVTSEEQFLHLTRYIHRQALASQGETLQDRPSSYEEYLGTRKTAWVHPESILAYFSKTNPSLSYRAFVLQLQNSEILQDILLD